MSRNEASGAIAQLDLLRIEEKVSMLRVSSFVLLATGTVVAWMRASLSLGAMAVVLASLVAVCIPTIVNWAAARRRQVLPVWWYIAHTADVLGISSVLALAAWLPDAQSLPLTGLQLAFFMVIVGSACRFDVRSAAYATAMCTLAYAALALHAVSQPPGAGGPLAQLSPSVLLLHPVVMLLAGAVMVLLIGRAQKLTMAVQEANRRQARVLSQLRDGVLVFSEDQRAIEVNGAACEILGLQRSNVLGLSLPAFMPAGVAEVLQGGWQQVLERGSLQACAIGFSTAQGERWIDLSAVKSSHAALPLVQLVIHEVTAELRLRQQSEQYDRLQALRSMTLGVAHEFNNLFATIGASSFILTEATPRQSPQYTEVEALRAAATRAARLARDLLDMAETRAPASHPVNTGALLHRVLEDGRTQGPQVTTQLEIAEGTRWIMADEGQLSRALESVIQHGYRAMLDGGSLRISARNVTVQGDEELVPGDYVRISVADTGIGMPPEVAASAFDPLSHSDSSSPGCVGLANVQSTVARNKGKVHLTSAVGRGTTISLMLPAAPAPAQPCEPKALEPRTVGQGRKLLVVDDEPANRTSLARLLSLRGYEVLLADDGAAAIRIAEQHGGKIDLVLLDLLMPEMNGKDVLTALRASHPSLKVLLVTGYAEQSMVQEAIDIGAAGVAYKPFDVPALLGQVQQLTAQA